MIVFGTDYDGVIINIEPQKAKAFGEIINKHWGINSNEASDFWFATGETSRRYKFDYFYIMAKNKKLSVEIYKKIENEYSQLLKSKYYPQVTILLGAKDLLEYAQSHFDFLFVSTGIPMDEIKYLVNLNGISQYYNFVLGTNQIYQSKRNHFNKIIAQKKPDSIFFIADSPEDMKIAKEFTNTHAIGVLTNHCERDLKKAGADYIVNNLMEAQEILRKF